MNQIIKLQKAIDYIENNIEEDINFETISKEIGLSPYFFHRMFSYVVGITPTEYIRNRRLSLAADELNRNNVNVLDIAIRYRFASNESFTRAFTKFHNVTPKLAKRNGTNLKNFSPIHLKLDVEGGEIMDYKIIEKEGFDISALVRDFNLEEREKIASFWNEVKENGKIKDINENYTKNVVGVCLGEYGSLEFKYGIGRILEKDDAGITEGEIIKINKSKWVVFSLKGQRTEDINKLWERIYKEFFPTSEYKQSMDIDFELYDDKNTEIWIPISEH